MNGWTYPVIIIAAIVIVLAILACSARAASITIRDGDTIVVSGEKIRLIGIDAPELDQPGGREARAELAAAIARAGGELRITRAPEPDMYGRTLARLYDGRKSINAEMVESGHAWAYYGTTYEAHQHRAYKARRGLWAGERWVAPWLWRKGYR